MTFEAMFVENFTFSIILILICSAIPFIGYLLKSKTMIWILFVLTFFGGLVVFGRTHNASGEIGAINGLVLSLKKYKNMQKTSK